MKIYIKGKGELELNKSDFIAQGGEGSVYAKSSIAYKLYTDQHKMIPIGKIQELSNLTHPNIIKPTDIILDKSNTPIGYTMRFVKNTYPLCQLFTKAFKQRENISHKDVFQLVKKLEELIYHTHSKNILIVDLNEMNYLVNDSFNEVYAIDVDSYQTKNYKATALMESIRDRHSPNTFNEGTDWFSFGIISFQMLIGIHPYKGKHSSIKTLDDRMLKNISVLNKDVSIPSVCNDTSIIPKNYLDWYKAVFESGKRLPPPKDGEMLVVIQKVKNVITGGNNFSITEIGSYDDDIVMFTNKYGMTFSKIKGEKYFINSKEVSGIDNSTSFGITPKFNHFILTSIKQNILSLYDVNLQKMLNLQLTCNGCFSYSDRIYFVNDKNFIEIMFTEIGNQNIIATPKVVGNCMPNVKCYDGCAIQEMLGSKFVSIFPKSGMRYEFNLKELEKQKVISAKYMNGVLMVISFDKTYNKYIFKFNEEFSKYEVYDYNKVDDLTINFVTLDNGVCIHLIEDGKMEIFSNKITSQSSKVIEDPVIKSDMNLITNGNVVSFIHENKIFNIKMK